MRYYLVIAAWFLLATACGLFVRRVALLLRGTAAVGRVESHEARQTASDSTTYFPVVRFKDAGGRWHRFAATAGSSRPRPPVGTALVVRYEGEDPSTAVIASFVRMWGVSLTLSVLSAGCMVAAALW